MVYWDRGGLLGQDFEWKNWDGSPYLGGKITLLENHCRDNLCNSDYTGWVVGFTILISKNPKPNNSSNC